MPALLLSLACMLMALGCTREAERRNSWISPSLTLEDVTAITIICDGGLIQDGGTIELYAVTSTADRCLIQLNQHALYGVQYRLDAIDSPGRLIFNERLISVRSNAEKKVLGLLKEAEFAPIGIEGLRKLVALENIENSDLQSLVSDPPNPYTQEFRDAIVDYVESEEYVDVAQNGLQLPP